MAIIPYSGSQCNRIRNVFHDGTSQGEKKVPRGVVVGELVATLHVEQGLAAVALKGGADGQAMLGVRDWVVAELAEEPVTGFLVDFRGCAMRCTPEELSALFDGATASDQVAVPAAMLVADADAALFAAHVWQVAWRGVVREAFKAEAEALEWLNARAMVAAQLRRQSPPA